MNALEIRLEKLDSGLLNLLNDSISSVELLLSKFSTNFPTYTDHSIKHTKEVFKIASELLTQNEIENLNSDEIYILSMSCLLHDIGMCLPKETLFDNADSIHKKSNSNQTDEDFIRDIHHELSRIFIEREYECLRIPSSKYAEAIGLVSMGHRKVSLDDSELYPTKFFVKSGRDFVCLPYLACILRFADELDITNIRTPKLLTKYYMPNNEISVKEWEKHISTTQINYTEDKVIFEVSCSDQNNLAALEEQFEKIQNVSNYCQKIIRTIANTEGRQFELKVNKICPRYKFIGFDPKGIQFSFNVQNVVKTFIGEDLYHNDLVAIREALQNSIDSCRYKRGIFKESYLPKISVCINDEYIKISDNGLGMDEFIVENFFGRLGSSFYEQEKVKKEFEAIGQFGVGVFSYFLLAEYIDIETKTENGSPLKFRLDKDPKNYFHFFDNPQMTNSGTTITLYKKEKIKTKYKFSTYLKYITEVFRYVDISIIVEGLNEKVEIVKKTFDLVPREEITKRLKIHHSNNYENYTLIKCHIDDSELEGECGMIVKNFKKNKSLGIENSYEIFDQDSFRNINKRHDKSQVGICQKGVFVNNYSSSKLGLIVGNINLKKGKNISISRSEFTDTKAIDAVIEKFEIGILRSLFKELDINFSDIIHQKLTDELFSNNFESYLFKYDYNNDGYLKVLEENATIKIIRKSVESIEKLKNIKNEKKFILLSSYENNKDTVKQLDDTIIIGSNYLYDGSYRTLKMIFIYLFKMAPSIELINEKAYLYFESQNYEEYINKDNILNAFDNYGMEYVDVKSEKITIRLTKNKPELKKFDLYYDDFYFNVSHPYSVFILNNYVEINNDTSLRKVVNNSFELISRITNAKRILKKDINQLNSLLQHLSKLGNPYSFNISDFQ